LRLAYLGTPELAVTPLFGLVEAGHEVAIVVSQPDRRRGRGGSLVPSPVKQAAFELGIPVTERVDDVLRSDVELGVVVAFGRLIRSHVLERVPMVNVHFSLLPRWRGAAPVERAILAGDERTGVCLMALDEGLDTGPLYDCREVPIGPEQTADELRRELARVGTELLLHHLAAGLPEPRPQSGEATYARKLEPAEHHLDWTQPAVHLHRVVRLGQAWTTFRGRRLRVLRTTVAGSEIAGRALEPGEIDPQTLAVGTGEGVLVLVDVQPEGRGRVPARSWRNGARARSGERLGP
jgi:methionyl-tRNA formyltransferase